MYDTIIEQKVENFINYFNGHPLSTENNRTPHQLFLEGCINNYPTTGINGALAALSSSSCEENVDSSYGSEVDPDIGVVEEDEIRVTVPQTPIPLAVDDYNELISTVTPVTIDRFNETFGLEEYRETIDFLVRKLDSGV